MVIVVVIRHTAVSCHDLNKRAQSATDVVQNVPPASLGLASTAVDEADAAITQSQRALSREVFFCVYKANLNENVLSDTVYKNLFSARLSIFENDCSMFQQGKH